LDFEPEDLELADLALAGEAIGNCKKVNAKVKLMILPMISRKANLFSDVMEVVWILIPGR
jgi:hypothetical protein